jgi:ATP-dependent DNA helicase RecQ
MSAALEILEKYWKYTSFRALQSDIITSVLNKKDTLALMPTGGGKSICFQVPGLMLDGVTIVITPLIALMKDQVAQLRERGILAAAIYSGMHKSAIDRTLDNFVLGDYKFLYVSPERLLTELMIERVKRMKVALLVIDEAHCISKWGHDFRPSYLKINAFKKYCPKAPIIALTATATAYTKKDILIQLELKTPNTFQMSFKRENLAIQCFESKNKMKDLANMLSSNSESSIVYAKTRKETQEISQFLKKCGLSADYYHAGLTNELRFKKQDEWVINKTRVMVSTNAFGMGIDKSDVRSVFHLHIPENMESYYQEIGRAGRDGKDSFVHLIYNGGDIEKLWLNHEQAYPPIDFLTKIYQSLCNFYQLAIGSKPEEVYEFDAFKFNSTFGLNAITTFYALKTLENQGLIELNDSFQSPSKFQFTINSHDLATRQDKNESLDNFTKTLLRIYGGELFLNPCIISESEIAKGFGTSKLQIEKLLRRLEKLGIGSYFQQTSKPTVNFLGQRYDAEKLPINHTQLKEKKKRDYDSIQRMVHYVTKRKQCRMARLQDYFGEENATSCGRCDVCIEAKKKEVRREAIEVIGSKIESKFPLSMTELIESEGFEIPLEEVIHYFVDNALWRINDGILEKSEIL